MLPEIKISFNFLVLIEITEIMRTSTLKICLVLILCFFTGLKIISQVPQGFNYQAIARGSDGKELANTPLDVKISILSDTNGFYNNSITSDKYVWEEQQSVITNNLGLFSLVVGKTPANWIQGTASSFSAIDWTAGPLYIGTKIYYSSSWKTMGSAKLWTVPYSMVSQNISGLKKLTVAGATTNMEEALFEVKNNLNQTVFAVYNEGVRVGIGDGNAKGTKGGFAIGGFGTKTDGQEYLRVTSDSTRVYVNGAAKGSKGGFAIGGFGTKTTTGSYLNITPQNYFIGYSAGVNNDGGTSNIFIGKESGRVNITGSDNVFLGFQAGYSNNASYNSFIGYQAGKANSSGSYNSFFGYNAGLVNSTGANNVFIGYESGKANTTGANNVFIGKNAGHSSNGDNNIFIGLEAGKSASGNDNIFIGLNAGTSLTSGTHNLLIGSSAGYNHTTQEYNVMLGTNAGYHLLGGSFWAGSFNTFMGINAGYKIANGKENAFIGTNAGYFIENGTGNTIVGIDAGRSGEEHDLGYIASYNTIMGDKAGYNITNGSENVIIGVNAGASLTSGSGNVFIGSYAGTPETGSNKLYIANSYDEDEPQPPLIYGDFSTGSVGIGTTTLTNKFNVGGDASVSGTLTAGAFSGNITGSVTGNVTGNLTGNVTGNVSGSAGSAGSVGGLTMGIISSGDGTFLTACGGKYVLSLSSGVITITNTTTGYCALWYQGQNAANFGGYVVINNIVGSTWVSPAFNANGQGMEMHFGAPFGGSYCSVWLNWTNSRVIGHYIMY